MQMESMKILIVDDEPIVLNLVKKILDKEGYAIQVANSGEKALEILDNESFKLVLSDIKMSEVSGMDVLKEIRQKYPDTGVVMLTAYGAVSTAVEAMKQGAFDYLTKPFKLDELVLTVQRALEYQQAVVENEGLKHKLEAAKVRFSNIVAESDQMRHVCDTIERVAPTNATILIQGDSGTGKELVARALHEYSTRKKQPFLPVNCAALPENLMESEMFGHVKGSFTGASADKKGLFKAASGGTLLLDEIGSMPLNIQSKLLRVMQDKVIRRVGDTQNEQINVRLIAASNENLEKLVEKKEFREDLFYRLSVITIDIPPLSERPEDILPITQHILKREIGEQRELPSLEHTAQLILENYSWPGNVRELENAIRHALTFSKNNQITTNDLPAKIAQSVDTERYSKQAGKKTDVQRCVSLKAFLKSKEQEYLKNIIEQNGGDKQKAAESLDISIGTLYRKLLED